MKFVEINYLLFLLGIENDTHKVCEFFFSRHGIVFDTRFFCGVLGFEHIIIHIIPIAPIAPKLPIFSKFPIASNDSNNLNDPNDPNDPTRELNLPSIALRLSLGLNRLRLSIVYIGISSAFGLHNRSLFQSVKPTCHR